MRKRDILVGLGILAVFGLGAILLILIAPNFFASEEVFPTLTPTAEANSNPATKATFTPTNNPTGAGTFSPMAKSEPTTKDLTVSTPTPTTRPIVFTPTSTAGRTINVSPTQTNLTVPQITQQPFTLPKGLGPSDGAKSCPQPLPLDKIRSDYLAYWDALKLAYKSGNPEVLKPYVDTQARDGKYWQGKQDSIVKTKQGGYWVDYQVEHTSPIIVKINPYYGNAGECQVSVFDGVKLTGLAKKVGSDEPFDSQHATPQVQEYKQSHSFEMNLQNGRWVIGGEGAGEL